MDTYFDNLEIQSAEDNVCNFERDYKIFYDDFSETKLQRIIDHIRKKANDPNLKFEKSAKGKILVPKSYWDDPYYEIDRVVHQGNLLKGIHKKTGRRKGIEPTVRRQMSLGTYFYYGKSILGSRAVL